jgi:hypothetical protein
MGSRARPAILLSNDDGIQVIAFSGSFFVVLLAIGAADAIDRSTKGAARGSSAERRQRGRN